MQKVSVAIYSGGIPSTTFIERLIIGLAEAGVQIILHGKVNGDVRYPTENIKVIGYSGVVGRVYVAFKFAVLFCLTSPHTLWRFVNCYPNRIFSPAFVKWFARTGPIVWYKPDIFHLQWSKGIEDWIFLQRFGIKVVVGFRGAHINYSPIVNKELSRIYARVFPNVDAFHGVSRAIRTEAAKYGADPTRCRVIYSGLNLEEFDLADRKTRGRSRLEIISVGRPHWKKGYHFALDAMKLLKARQVPFRYRIVGGISEEMLFQIHDLGLADHVEFQDSVSFERAKTLISVSDVLLIPSVEEGIPNVMLEAMALGTIVVSSSCGGVTEVVRQGENGFLVPVRDPEAIADMIQYVQDCPEGILDSIRCNARATVERHHDQRAMVSEMKAFYRHILQTS